ncbi:unnamed protein product [Schistosoma turkestanicum]|nr:unnamed protein product [Schistosoma turkestanicum]
MLFSDNANQSCILQRHEMHKNECSFKRLKNLWKQQFDQFILPVLARRICDINNIKYTEEEITTQKKNENHEMTPNLEQLPKYQFESISQCLSSSESLKSLCTSEYEVKSYHDFGEDFLKRFEDRYTFSDSSNLTEQTIYLYCSTCSQIFVCKNPDELQRLNATESDLFSSTYYFTSDDEDIGDESVSEASLPSSTEYLNPAYEWIKSSRSCSAPPILCSVTKHKYNNQNK